MVTFIPLALVGTLMIVMGSINMTGNISSLHSYHRKRVSEEDRKPFGRLVGLGTLLIGIGIIAFGALMWIHEETLLLWIAPIATALLIVSIVVGLVISFYAMMKYNKGIF